MTDLTKKIQDDLNKPLIEVMQVTQSDFPEENRKNIQDIVATAIYKHNTEKEISYAIKKAMDSSFQDRFNVVVGRHFGANLTATVERYIYLQVGTLQVLIFKSQC